MSVELKLHLPEETFSALKMKPDEFLSQMRVAAAVKWYEQGKVSQSKASEIAGISRKDFLNALNSFGVSPFQVDENEILEEIQN